MISLLGLYFYILRSHEYLAIRINPPTITDDYERMNIADALVSQTYADGEQIITQV